MPTINATNLRTLRKRERLSLDALAQKARVDRGTIHRIESGKRADSRRTTVERLADALNTDVGTLTGPSLDVGAPVESSRKSQMGVRISDEARNALTLVGMRYGVKPSNIVALAPLLFLWAAEESLKRRKERLDRLEEQWAALGATLPHGHMNAARSIGARAAKMMDEERSSIAQRDIFALALSDDLLDDGYEPTEHNPMASFLRELAASLDGLAEFEYWWPSWGEPGYVMGREEAAKLVGEDVEAVSAIVCGHAAIHEIPKELRDGPDTARTAEWVRERGDKFLAQFDLEEEL